MTLTYVQGRFASRAAVPAAPEGPATTEAVLRAVADSRRRAILHLLRRRELPAGAIATHFPVTRPAISQHLRVLKAAGLVTERRAGTRRFYRARPEGFAGLREFLRAFWDERLRRLRRAAEQEERRGRRARGGP